MLTVAPAAKGLFVKTIPMSGNTAFCNTSDFSAQVAEKFMVNSGAKTVGELVKKSTAEIKNIYEKIIGGGLAENPSEYLPTCDGNFLPENPFQALKNGAARGIKFLTGNVADEWRLWLQFDEIFCEKYRNNTKKFSLVLSKYKEKTLDEVYKNWLKNCADNEENFIDFANNLDWRVGQELAAEYQSKFGDVYYYLFSEQSPDEKLRSCL